MTHCFDVSTSFRHRFDYGNRTGCPCPLLAVLFGTYNLRTYNLRQLVLRQLSRENSAIFLFYYSFMNEPQPLRDGKRVVGGFHKVLPIKKFFKVCGYKIAVLKKKVDFHNYRTENIY